MGLFHGVFLLHPGHRELRHLPRAPAEVSRSLPEDRHMWVVKEEEECEGVQQSEAAADAVHKILRNAISWKGGKVLISFQFVNDEVK